MEAVAEHDFVSGVGVGGRAHWGVLSLGYLKPRCPPATLESVEPGPSAGPQERVAAALQRSPEALVGIASPYVLSEEHAASRAPVATVASRG